MKKNIDINCDLGEGMENDAFIMPYIHSANIACGLHAGDDDTIRRTIDLCLRYKVNVGAHPSFDDQSHFGRSERKIAEPELYDLMINQIKIIDRISKQAGAKLHHVKPHGALYNMASRDALIAAVIVKAIKDFDKNLILYGLSGSHLIAEAHKAGLNAYNEIFADRTYQDDGQLTPRANPNALIRDPAEAVHQVLHALDTGTVTTTHGKEIALKADTICVHGDNPGAVDIAEAIFLALGKQKRNNH